MIEKRMLFRPQEAPENLAKAGKTSELVNLRLKPKAIEIIKVNELPLV